MVDILGTIATGFGNMGTAVSNYLGNTGGSQGFGGGGAGGRGEPQFRMDDSGTSMEQVPIEPMRAAQAIPVDTGSYFNPVSESGDINRSVFLTDTGAPPAQTFLGTYVPEARITTLAGYTTGDRGDTKTALLEKEYGYSPMQALAMQEDAAKASGDKAAARYYRGEWERAQRDVEVGASQESYEKAKSGIAQAPNTQEYAADLARSALWRSQGVVNVPGFTRDGSGALKSEFKPFEGSMLAESNVITKAMRTGDMGPYGTLGKPFSSVYGTLDLDTQQAISRQAAKTAGWNYEAEDVASPVREKYENPLVLTGRGFNMFYTEAMPKGVTSDLLSTEYNPTKTSDRFAKLALMKPGTAYVNLAKEAEMISPVVQGPNEGKGNVRQAQNIITQTIPNIPVVTTPDAAKYSAGVVNTVNLAKFSKVAEPEKISTHKPESYAQSKLGVGDEALVGNLFEHIDRIGGPSKSIMHQIEYGNVARRSRPSYPVIGRTFYVKPKHSKVMIIKPQPKPQSDPKIFNLESINKNIMPKSLGADLFKFNLNSPDKLVKSIGVRTRVQESVKIKGDALGLAQVKDIAGNINISDFGTRFAKGKGVSDVSGNINALVKNMLNPVKIRKIKLK